MYFQSATKYDHQQRLDDQRFIIIINGKEETVSKERSKPAFIAKTDSEMEDNQRPDVNNFDIQQTRFKTYSNKNRLAFVPNVNFKQ